MAKARMVQGTCGPEGVWIDDEAHASRILDKTAAGTRHGTRLLLHWVEAAWLQTQGRIVTDRGVGGLLESAPGTETTYLVYADLRARGLAVRIHRADQRRGGDPAWRLGVWERGRQPAGPDDGPDAWYHPAGERDAALPDALWAAALHNGCMAIVDEDGAVTHYAVRREAPTGGMEPADAQVEALPVERLADHVLVPGDPGVWGPLVEQEGAGTVSEAGLLLSFTEATYLARRGRIDEDAHALARLAGTRQLHFDRTLPVYEDLRSRGVVARSGFRFGTHLRGYEGPPDEGHAQWLIQCVRPDEALHWSTLSRGVRLAHGVRKRFLLAVAGDEVRYVGLSWHRP